MDESRILRPSRASLAKSSLRASGSGMVTEPLTPSHTETDMDETAITTSVNFKYNPHHPPLSQSDLRNALCAKNYEWAQYSETYQIDVDLIKDTKTYQDDSICLHQL